MTSSPRLRVIDIALFEQPFRLRMPFRFGVITVTHGQQAIARVRIRRDDGREGDGYAAEALGAKWFDKNPALTDEQNIDQLRKAIELAGDAYRAAPPQTAFDLSAGHYRQQLDSGAALGLLPLVASYGPALLDRAVLDALCRLEGISFSTAMRTNLPGMRAHPIVPDLAGFDFGAFLAQLEPASTIESRHTVGLVDPIVAADQAPGTRVDDGLPETLEEVVATYGHRYFKLKVAGHVDADLERLTRIAGVLDTIRDPYQITLDGNEQYDDVEAIAALWEAMEDEPALQRLCASTLFIEQPIKRQVALSHSIQPLARFRPVIIDESDGDLDAFPRARARLCGRLVEELQGLLQVADQPGALPGLEHGRRRRVFHVGRRPDDAGGPLRAAGPGAGQPARPDPRRAQRPPLHRRLRRPAGGRDRGLPRGPSGPLPAPARTRPAAHRGRPAAHRLARMRRLRHERDAGPVGHRPDAEVRVAVGAGCRRRCEGRPDTDAGMRSARSRSRPAAGHAR
jgi:hypothetical protein